jgi:hypothetical protein
MRHRVLGLGGLAVALACCVTQATTPPVGAPEPGTADDCAKACARLRSLGCEEGKATLGEDGIPNTADDSTCEQTCNTVESSGYMTLNSRCAEKINACSELAGCGWSAE